jgi:hypothetical protein
MNLAPIVDQGIIWLGTQTATLGALGVNISNSLTGFRILEVPYITTITKKGNGVMLIFLMILVTVLLLKVWLG